MFGRGFHLFTVFGFEVKIDLSWFIIAVLVTWSLAVGLFPMYYPPGQYPQLTAGTYWWMGAVGALGLFLSIVAHELSHSLEARRHGVEMKGITLFVFGGVAEMTEEPPNPKAEFLVALAGPAASVAIAVVAYLLYRIGLAGQWPVQARAILWYLAFINIVLVAFNMLPAFPLDGGRVFRSILWYFGGNLRWATRVTSMMGSAFGILLIVAGVFYLLMGYFIAGLWWAVLGLFLRSAAQMSYQQLLMRRVLEGEPVRRFMQPEVQTVPPTATVRELVEDYVYRYHFKMFPVVEGDRLVGCISTADIREIPRQEWDKLTVIEVAHKCSSQNTIAPDADAMKALTKMNETGASRLMVVEDQQLRGIVSFRDLMRLISLRLELEEG